jgi:hypothetical protein
MTSDQVSYDRSTQYPRADEEFTPIRGMEAVTGGCGEQITYPGTIILSYALSCPLVLGKNLGYR